MSKLNEIQQRLSKIDATRFHKLVDTYLNKKYFYSIHSTGTKIGEDKPRKGTPDTLITLESGEYIFVEYTTQKTKIKDKFLDDISKCLDVDKTGILIQKVKKIILACNSSLQSNDIETLKQSCGDIECEVLTNSTLSYDLVNHYPAVVKDFLGIDIGNVLTSSILKDKYLNDNNFSTIKLLINSTPKPIEDIFINLAIIKDKEEKQKDEKIPEKQIYDSNWETRHKPKGTIELKDLIKTSRKSLIYGKAGIGKTTLCKHIVYMWAKGKLYEEFEYVIYLPLRQWSSIRLKEEIRNYYTSQTTEEIILDIENNDKVLFLFDGYDELKADKKQEFQKAVKDSQLIHYIITSRPYGYQRNDFSVDEHFETIGFTDENVDSYIDNFFKKDDKKSQSLKNYLQSNISIKHIAYIPLMLEMICSLWNEKKFNDALSITELYNRVVENFLEKHSKNRDDETVYEWENREEIKELLGKIAFDGLTKQTILFDGKFIRDIIGRDNLDFFKTSIVNSGFLKSDVKDKSLLGNNFEFPHLTFQEYFSALYVSNLSQEEQSEIIQDWKFYPHMQMFFAFLGGLIEDKNFFFDELFNKGNNIVAYNVAYTYTLILKFLPNINKETLSDEKIKLIEEYFLKEFDRTLDYKDFLDKLKLVSSFISNRVVEEYIKMLNNEDYSIDFRKDLIIFLFSIGRYDESVVSAFVKIVESSNSYEGDIFSRKGYLDINKVITEELIDLGNNHVKNIEVCFTIIENSKHFYKSIDIIENLFKKYVKHKDVIVSSSMNWLELMIEDDENSMLRRIVYETNYDLNKSFFSFLVNQLLNTSSFLDPYVALLNENIEKERKLFIAMFLYFMNKTSPKVISVLMDSPLDTFNNCEFGLMEFIKKDIDRGTNIFKTFESSLKEKKVSLSFENSHEMLKEVIQDIGSEGTEELDEKLLNFITEYYIENENIDLQHRKDIIRPSRFYLIKGSNKTIQKIFQEDYPQYLDKKEQNIKLDDDISQEKNIFVWDIEKVIKERWNLDDFLKFIRYSHKKKVIELVTEFQFTDKNIETLIELMFNQDVEFHFTQENIKTFIALMFDDSIELKVRRDITKALYENDVDNDKVLQQLTEYINKTDLKFIVRANPKIESSSNFNVVNALVEKLNRYYDEEEWLVHYFKEYNLYAFLNNEKVVDILFRIVRSTSISSHNKKDLLRYVNYKDISSDKVSDTLIEFIVDRKKYFYNLD